MAAITLDWLSAVIVSFTFFQYDSLATLGIFAVAQMLFLVTVGGSIGHLLFRMRLVPIRGGRLGIWQPIVRTLLVCLVIPAVIWDRDQRGMHDRLVGTVLVMVK
jgi:uncharacterized RDD family membrane protein YckC